MTIGTEYAAWARDRGTEDARGGSGSNGTVRPMRRPFAEEIARPLEQRAAALAGGALPADADHAVIAAVAFELWQRRGGDAADNWFEAERIVRSLAGPGRRSVRVW